MGPWSIVLILLSSVPALADLTGRCSAGGQEVFVLYQRGSAVTGTIQGRGDEPSFKIVDGMVRGNRIQFFVLHEDENDPEVKANGGKPFHNLAMGTFTQDEIIVSGSRENTKIREYRLVLKRIKKYRSIREDSSCAEDSSRFPSRFHRSVPCRSQLELRAALSMASYRPSDHLPLIRFEACRRWGDEFAQ